MSSTRPVFGVLDDNQPHDPVVPPPSEAVNRPAVTPLDVATAVVDPSSQLEAGKAAETTNDDVAGTTDAQATSATAQPVRKTCIVKLDGCHYTIGTNALYIT